MRKSIAVNKGDLYALRRIFVPRAFPARVFLSARALSAFPITALFDESALHRRRYRRRPLVKR